MFLVRDSLFLEISVLRGFLLVVPHYLEYTYYSYLLINNVRVSDFKNYQNLSEVVTNYMKVELEQMMGLSCKVMLSLFLVACYFCEDLKGHTLEYFDLQEGELEQMMSLSCKVMLNLFLVARYFCEDLKGHRLEYFDLEEFCSSDPPLSFCCFEDFLLIAGNSHG